MTTTAYSSDKVNLGISKSNKLYHHLGPTVHTINLVKISISFAFLVQFTPLNSMANIHKLLSPSIMYTILLHLSFLLFTTTTTNKITIHQLLVSRGLPAGLFPRDVVKSYDLNEENGLLQVYLHKPCLTKYETWVYFDSVVRANITYGGLLGVQGLSEEELFIWLPVKDILVNNPFRGVILFDIGLAHRHMALSLFNEPPSCNPNGVLMKKSGEKEVEIHDQ